MTCKPGSLLEHLYAVKREHEKQDLAFLTKGITHYATKSLGMEYEIIHGPESLAPRKREALTPTMVKSLIRAVVGLRTKLRGFGLIERAAKSLRIEQADLQAYHEGPPQYDDD